MDLKLTRHTQEFNGVLSNGTSFSLEFIRRENNWLFGINLSSGKSFYTTSEDFKDRDFSAVEPELRTQLVSLGIPKEDVSQFVEQFIAMVTCSLK